MAIITISEYTLSENLSSPTTLRTDLKFFVVNPKNLTRYGDGFHLGPYFKYRFEDIRRYDEMRYFGYQNERASAFFLGGLIGFQNVSKHAIINPHFGVGLGVRTSPFFGTEMRPDLRMGCSIGLVAF